MAILHKHGIRRKVYLVCCAPFLFINQLIAKEESQPGHVAFPKPIVKTDNIKPIIRADSKTTPQSKLFALPLELRLLIYNYVFGPGDIYLRTFKYLQDQDWNSKSLYYISPHSCLYNCVGMHIWNCPCVYGRRWKLDMRYSRRVGNLGKLLHVGREIDAMNMMTTCRDFYCDTVTFLFHYSTFRFEDLNTIILASITKPYRFDSIRSLYLESRSEVPHFEGTISHLPPSYLKRFAHLSHLQTSGDNTPGIWDAACDAISKITSLKQLKFKIYQRDFQSIFDTKSPGIRRARIYEPLQKIGLNRDLEIFEVIVDWPEGEDDEWGEFSGQENARMTFVLTRIHP